MTKEPHQWDEEGKRAFAAGRYAESVSAFREAARGFTLGRDGLHAAEANNNLSVALLKNNKPQEAFEVVDGTDKIFESAGNVKMQAMALGNQATALEALKRNEEALALYERSAALFAQAGEGDMQSMVLKSAAAIRLKQGKFNETAIDMLGSLGAAKKPTLTQRFLKFLLRFKP